MKAWFTAAEVAELLHVGARTMRRLIRPHRAQCHLARNGANPRLVLWVPASVVRELRDARRMLWKAA